MKYAKLWVHCENECIIIIVLALVPECSDMYKCTPSALVFLVGDRGWAEYMFLHVHVLRANTLQYTPANTVHTHVHVHD